MAGLMQYEGTLPPQISQAAQNYLDYQKALQAKLPLAVEGSAVPDGVRKAAQAALERGVPQAAAEAAPAVGRGVLGTLGRVAGGPVSAGLMAMEPSELGNSDLSPSQREALNPGEQADAQAYAQRVQQNAAQSAQSPLQGAGLLQAGVDQQQEPQVPDQAPQQSPMTAQPQAAPQPQVAPQVAQEQQQRQVEGKRQTIEQGTLKGLQTGQVSVSELAGGVVDADAQRAGTQLTPVEKKKAVETEIQAMKTMDKSNLSRYVSYALIAGGLLAAVLDKTGKAGEAFSTSFNRQLDRNLASGKMSADMYNKAMDRQLKERAETRQEGDSEVNAAYKTGLLGQGDRKITQGDRKLDQGDTGLDLKERSIDQTGRIASADLGVKQQGVNLQGERLRQSISNADRDYELDSRKVGLMETNPQADRESRERIATERAAAAAKTAATKEGAGVPMSNKEAVVSAKAIAKERGDNLSDAVVQSVAAYIPTVQKLNPGMSINDVYEFALQKMAPKLSSQEQYMGFGTNQIQIKKRKE